MEYNLRGRSTPGLLRITLVEWPPTLLMHGLELAAYPFLMVRGQLIVPELEGVVGIIWSICLV